MTLDFNKVAGLLEESGDEFASFRDDSEGEVRSYREAMKSLQRVSGDVVDSMVGRVGARFLEPMGESFYVPFRRPWDDRDGCMVWMDGVLGKRTVASVDGGQIYHERA